MSNSDLVIFFFFKAEDGIRDLVRSRGSEMCIRDRGTGGEGEVDWVYLTELPKLLNREEMARNIRRFYPEEERRAGHEGQVVARLHLKLSLIHI